MNNQPTNQLKNHLNNPDINWQYIAIVCFLSLLMVSGLLVYQLKQKDIEILIIRIPEKQDKFAEERAKIAFDVYYSEKSLDEIEQKWFEAYAIPKVVDSGNEVGENGFKNYVLSLYPVKNAYLVEEEVSAESAINAIGSFLKNIETDGYFQCYPYSHFLKNNIASVVLYCESSGGAHPIYYLSAVNYDLENNKAIELEEIIKISLEELKLFIKENIEDAKFCEDDTITNFYFKREGLVFTLAGHRLNPYCPPDADFLFSFDKIRDIIKRDSIVSRLLK